MECGQGSRSNTDLKTHSCTDESEKAMAYSESSSSSSDNLEDTFEINTERATQSPPKQVMEGRIPAGVFETSKSRQMDWSTASAESLFSIQMSFNTEVMGPTAAETMKEVIRENESKQLHSHPQHYDDTALSVQSFAFDPVLTIEGAHSKGKHNKATMPTTPKLEQQTPKMTETPKQQNPKTKKKWLSYFPCCN